MGDITKAIDKLSTEIKGVGSQTAAIVNSVAGQKVLTVPTATATTNNSNANSKTTNSSHSRKKKRQRLLSTTIGEEKLENVPLIWAIISYVSYIFLVVTGYLREAIWGIGPINSVFGREFKREGYAPLYSSFEGFYTRNIFRRFKPVVQQPICSVPAGEVYIRNRISEDHYWTSKMLDSSVKCINLGSYNYLGYAENEGPCTDAAVEAIGKNGISHNSPRSELGSLECHKELERTVAEFVGAEDAITLGMGFATNSLNIPSLVSKGCLILSDELNHASLILGMRLSGATVMVFKHGNVEHLEKLLRQAIIKGHPRTRREWNKILIVVEGVYSMEGTICRLPEIVALKKKYGAYIYLDEAHSVGAMGPNGRGVVDYFGLNPKDIDILMGTFTKSFGAAGGYIAGSKKLIDHLRTTSHAQTYSTSVSPPVAMQVVAAMKQIMNKECAGLSRIQRLADNSRYFRQRLKKMGLIVYGDDDSPVIPILLIMPAKILAFVETMKRKGIATVTVGFPAVPMTKERARFCMSSSHDQQMIEKILDAIEETADELSLRYSQIPRNKDKVIKYGSA